MEKNIETLVKVIELQAQALQIQNERLVYSSTHEPERDAKLRKLLAKVEWELNTILINDEASKS